MRLLSGSLALLALGGTPTDHRHSWYPLDTADSLRSWLTDQAARWQADDPCFAAHRAVGLAELNAGATYQALVQSRDEAARLYQDAPGRAAIEDTTRMLAGGERAVAGLRAFVEGRSDADDEVMRARRARAALKLKACGESEADRVSGLLLHHVTEETKVWMLHFQRELSVLRFTTCQEKGCVPLLWEVRCRKDCARSVPRRVCLTFVA